VGILSAWARHYDNYMFVRMYVCMRRSRIAGANTAGTGYNIIILYILCTKTTLPPRHRCGAQPHAGVWVCHGNSFPSGVCGVDGHHRAVMILLLSRITRCTHAIYELRARSGAQTRSRFRKNGFRK